MCPIIEVVTHLLSTCLQIIEKNKSYKTATSAKKYPVFCEEFDLSER